MPPSLYRWFVGIVAFFTLYAVTISTASILGMPQFGLNILCGIGKLLVYLGSIALITLLCLWWLKYPNKNKGNRNDK